MRFFFVFSCIVSFFGVAPVVFAIDANGLVTCDGVANAGTACTFCHFMSMVEKVAQFLVSILIIISVIMLAVTGVQLAMSAGNDASKTLLKERMTNIIIGFVIILASWILVDTLMKAIVSDGQLRDNWRTPIEELCGQQLVPVDSPRAGTDVAIGPGPGGYNGPVEISPAGASCFPGPNGVYDGGPLQGGDDVCLTTVSVDGADYNLPNGSHLGYTAPTQYFGPDDIAANPQLTPNLRLCDVTNCDPSRRNGEYVAIDPFMVAQLQNVYTDLGGLSVNSGYRSPSYNRGVGGATHSRHQYGDAVDIAVGGSNTEASIKASCSRRGATNIYTYDSGAHVHCDWRGAAR